MKLSSEGFRHSVNVLGNDTDASFFLDQLEALSPFQQLKVLDLSRCRNLGISSEKIDKISFLPSLKELVLPTLWQPGNKVSLLCGVALRGCLGIVLEWIDKNNITFREPEF